MPIGKHKKRKINLIYSTMTDRIPKLCKLAIDNHLYVDGWQMILWLHKPLFLRMICLAYEDGVPVGVAVLTKSNDLNFGVFVKELHRRKGYGTLLYKKIESKFKTIHHADWLSQEFFASVHK
jgi:GNAT superfamily N-acetyltransferase